MHMLKPPRKLRPVLRLTLTAKCCNSAYIPPSGPSTAYILAAISTQENPGSIWYPHSTCSTTQCASTTAPRPQTPTIHPESARFVRLIPEVDTGGEAEATTMVDIWELPLPTVVVVDIMVGTTEMVEEDGGEEDMVVVGLEGVK
ncbi:hypothetical protein VTN00DRAFT_5019 [Thermoascus crustaceus]|uniref:uncharacterized protein n=1 Tax=Thermoascus crustaceus TaxID=5088 RepID=UPI0037434562